MRISKSTWDAEVARVGEYWARRNLRSRIKPYMYLLAPPYIRPDLFACLQSLAALPGRTSMGNRKAFADVLRAALMKSKMQRKRIAGFAKNTKSGGCYVES